MAAEAVQSKPMLEIPKQQDKIPKIGQFKTLLRQASQENDLYIQAVSILLEHKKLKDRELDITNQIRQYELEDSKKNVRPMSPLK